MRPMWTAFWNQRAALSDVSTQTETAREHTMMNARIEMLQQQVHDKDERIEDLDSLVWFITTKVK